MSDKGYTQPEIERAHLKSCAGMLASVLACLLFWAWVFWMLK